MLIRGRVAPNHAYQSGKKMKSTYLDDGFFGDGLSGSIFCSRQDDGWYLLDLPVLHNPEVPARNCTATLHVLLPSKSFFENGGMLTNSSVSQLVVLISERTSDPSPACDRM